MRIVGGEWRSRRIAFPAREDLRPTPDRVRETLFNWLGQDLRGRACLDLFAGSGALGFEAASRGAIRVVMVERDALAAQALAENRERLSATGVSVVRGDALAYLEAGPGVNGRFDVVFLDPPFRQNLLLSVLERLPRWLADDARVYAESARDVMPPGWRALRQARAGQVHYQLLETA